MSSSSDVSAARSVAFDLLRSVLARRKSFDDAMAMGADGRIREAATLIALQWLALNRDRLRTKWK